MFCTGFLLFLQSKTSILLRGDFALDYYDENLFHIYGIKNNETNEVIYIGCTVQDLIKRLYQHCHSTSSAIYEVIHDYGEDKFSIFLIKDYEGTLEEAHFIEAEISKMYNEDKELFNKKFGDEFTANAIAKLKKPRKLSQGIKNLLKYAKR